MSSGRIELEKKEIDLEMYLEKLISVHEADAKNKGLKFKLIKNLNGIRILTDENLLGEIINNLLSNAVIYTENGEVEFKIEIEEEKSKKNLKFKVKDSGIGIPEEGIELIWGEFRQMSEGLSRKFEGVGIGLSIVKRCIQLLNGRISVLSEVGKGTEFYVEIPVESHVPLEPLLIEEKKVGEIKNEDVKNEYEMKKKILQVEDDKITVIFTSKILSADYEYDSANNSSTAITKVNEKQYDLILMDINLRDKVNGIDLSKTIRGIAGYEKIPIVAVTAYADEFYIKMILENGMDYCLTKPFNIDELKKLLIKIFGEK